MAIVMPSLPRQSYRVSSSFEDIPVLRSADLPPLAAQLRRWRRKVMVIEDADITDRQFARQIGVSDTVWSKLLTGKYEPHTPPRVCAVLADFFGRYFSREATEDAILELGGHITYHALIGQLEALQEEIAGADHALEVLQVTQKPAWRFSMAMEKRQADQVLQDASLQVAEKARRIVALIERWQSEGNEPI